ncbi:MAG: hypothetical protein K6A64_03990 [Bacteroidales bacterium]|nr:hypothetical protein [Bacteroidales bacterium]
MKKIFHLCLEALLTPLALLSCDKTSPDDNGREKEPFVLPEVVTDLVIGEKAFPIKTFNINHAITIAAYEELDILFTEDDINALEIFDGYRFPICVRLGDLSLQEAYDMAIPKKGMCLLAVTDKELSAEDYSFFKEIPVGILPESALETIRESLQKESSTYYFNAKFQRREALFSPGFSLGGKQWIYTSVFDGTSAVCDFGVAEKGKALVLTINTPEGTAAGWQGTSETGYSFVTAEIPESVDYTDQNETELSEVSDAKLELETISGQRFEIENRFSLGGYLVGIRNKYDEEGTVQQTIPFVFTPLSTPVRMNKKWSSPLIATAAGKSFPVWINDTYSSTQQAFLEKGANVPIIYLDAFGTAEDFNGLDLNGKIAVIKRGQNTFTDKLQNAANAGADGVLCINTSNINIFPVLEGEDLPFGAIPQYAEEILKTATTVSFSSAE